MDNRVLSQILTKFALPFGFLTVALLVTVAVYYPGLSGPFFFDDIFNIQENQYLRLQALDVSALRLAAFSTETGPLLRPLSMLSFAFNFYLFGEGTTSFKVVNLSIHLLNGALIFALVRLLLRLVIERKDLALISNRVDLTAALVAALWLVHPINLTSVLYVVQRMASLSALFVLLCLLSYIRGRLLFARQRMQSIAFWTVSVLFGICGLASKENALLLPWYIFLIEWLFLFPIQRPTSRVRIYTFAWLIVPLVGGLIYLAWHPGMLHYDFRPFTLWERVFTEIRALWFYAGLVFLPRPTVLGIFHDDFPLSTGLFNPWTTVPAALGWLLVFGFALYTARRRPLLAFGVLFFLVAHALESSIFPLEIMHEHRNYLASLGLLFGVIASLLLVKHKHRFFQSKAVGPILLVFFVFFAAISYDRALNWQETSRLILNQVDHHPESAASNYEAGRLFIRLRDQTQDQSQKDEFNRQGLHYFTRMVKLWPQDAAGPLALLLSHASNAKLTNAARVTEAINRLRSRPPGVTSITILLSLSRCERKGDCVVSQGQIDALFQALLANPLLSGKPRAALFDEFAFRAMKAGRFGEAERFFKTALAINDSSAMYRLNYALLLIRSGRFEEAQGQIGQVLATPQPPAIRKIADALKRRIAQHRLPDLPGK